MARALALISALLTGQVAEAVGEAERPSMEGRDLQPQASVWVQPLGAIATGLEGELYLPLGMNVSAGSHADVVLEATPTWARWYGCYTRSLGGWGAFGVALFADLDRTGWFVQPKVIGRTFHTSGGAPSLGYIPCDYRALHGGDFELRAGADLGYAWRWGAVSAAAAFGASAGYCWNCVLGTSLTEMNMFQTTPRRNRTALGVNPNLLRVGVSF